MERLGYRDGDGRTYTFRRAVLFFDLFLRNYQAASLLDQRIIVAIDSWPRNSMYPLGHFVRKLGPIGDKDTENEVLLLEHDVPHGESFPSLAL